MLSSLLGSGTGPSGDTIKLIKDLKTEEFNTVLSSFLLKKGTTF